MDSKRHSTLSKLLLVCIFNAFIFFSRAQNNSIVTCIIGNNLVYYSIADSTFKSFPLSDNSIANEFPRCLEYNPDLCENYVITSFRSGPKLHIVSPTGQVNSIGKLKMNDGRSIYSCEAIAYNELDKKLYGSISFNNVDYYTETLVCINPNTAVCTQVSEIYSNGTFSDMDFLECYNGKLIIGDGDNAPFYKIYEVDIADIPATFIPTEIYSDNLIESGKQQEFTIAGDYLYYENNQSLYSADLRNTPLVFSLVKKLNIPTLNSPLLALSSFPYPSILGLNKQLSADTTICQGDTLQLDKSSFTSFNWNDGNTDVLRSITTDGTYFGTGQIGGCTIPSDTFTLKTKPCNKCDDYYEEIQYYLQLGRDIEMCYGEFYSIVLPRLIDSVFWMDGTQGRAKHLTETASLSAIVKVDSCVFYSDTIQITFVDCDACKVHFPNAFTPNNDAVNNTFKPLFNDACNFRFETFEVYNRWGEKLYESTKGEWDGTFQNERVQQGVYYYIVKIKELNRGSYTVYSGPIQVLY